MNLMFFKLLLAKFYFVLLKIFFWIKTEPLKQFGLRWPAQNHGAWFSHPRGAEDHFFTSPPPIEKGPEMLPNVTLLRVMEGFWTTIPEDTGCRGLLGFRRRGRLRLNRALPEACFSFCFCCFSASKASCVTKPPLASL